MQGEKLMLSFMHYYALLNFKKWRNNPERRNCGPNTHFMKIKKEFVLNILAQKFH